MDLWFVWQPPLTLCRDIYKKEDILHVQWPLSIALGVQQKQLVPSALKCISVAYMTLQHINALSVAVFVLKKLCLDNRRWPLWLQGLCYVWKSNLFHGNQMPQKLSGLSSTIVLLFLDSQGEQEHLWEMKRSKSNWDKQLKYLPVP